MASTIDRIAYEAGRLLRLIAAVTRSPDGPKTLLGSLGWDLPPGAQDIGLAALDVSALSQKIDDLEAALESGETGLALDAKFGEVLVELVTTFVHVRGAVAGLSVAGDYLDKTQIKSQFLPRLNSLMGASRIGAASPLAYVLLQLFGILTVTPQAADPSIYQVEHLRFTIHWDDLPRLFKDPVGLLEQRYGWGTPAFDAQAFVANLCALVETLGEPARLRQLPRRVEEQLAGRLVPEADSAPFTQLIASFARGDDASGFDAGVSLFPLRASAAGASDGGIAIAPFVFGASELKFALTPQLTLEFDATVGLDSGVALLFRPAQPVELKAELLGAGGVVENATGKALLKLTRAAPEGGRLTLFEIPGGGVVDVGSIAFAGGVQASQGALAPSVGVHLADGHATLNWSGSDGFLGSLMPAGGVDLKFDLGLRWSGAQGFSFEGSAAADLDIAIHRSLFGLRIDSLHVGLRPSDAALVLELSLSGGASIGPVAASFDRIGTLASFAFHEGNLGPLDLSVDFQPPAGLGVVIDAGSVLTGGGFIYHDPVRQMYAGALQLSLHERITLKAFGLLATVMPDGSRGYSLIVFITAEGFQPIQLGMGFTLSGIGGMVAIHRTFDEDVLRAGLKSDTLGSLLFPRDPVGNAPALITALAAAFPAKQGSYLLGLLVRIGWFTPPLVLLDLALILEFGARTRLLVLGRISALLPSPDNDLVRLILDSMGVIDFDQGTASIDAVLVDSRLAHKFAMTGAMALRARWSSGPGSGFILAVGGLNPHFAPPEGLPALQRVGIALSSGDNPRLNCDAYFAITSNTVQFGAHAQLYAAAYGFSVEGDIGFDVLIQIAPLHFIADFNAKVQLKHGSSNLFMVSVDGELEGPRPLRVSGKASFSIFWCDFSVRFDRTLVDGEAPPPPPAIDVLAQLKAALAQPQSWTAQRAPGHTQGVALRALPPGSTQVVLDPLGRLLVKQQVVPLNTGRDIEIFGGAPVTGAKRFQLKATLNGTEQHTDNVRDQFAPATFFELSDDEKLAAPSFETMDAGLVFGDAAVSFDATQAIAAPLEYEQIVIDDLAAPPPQQPPPKQTYTLRADKLIMLSRSGAAARAPIRSAGLARFRTADAAPAATLEPPSWRIVPLADGTPAALDPAIKTWSEHLAALTSLNRGAASWQIVPAHELTDA